MTIYPGRNMLLLFLTILAFVVANGAAAHVHTLYQFPIGSWLENIAVRSNGNLLLTRLDVPELWQLDPSSRGTAPERLVSVPDATSVFGIAEIAHDVFAFAAGNFSSDTGTVAGSWNVRKLDFTGGKEPRTSKIADVPSAVGPLNGLTVLPATGPPHGVLVGDIRTGVVYHISPLTGDVNIAVNDSLTAAAPNPTFGDTGVNGIHVHPSRPDALYLANTGKNILASQPIDALNGQPTEEGTVIANVTTKPAAFNFDDFALPHDVVRDDAAYIVTGSGNSVERLSLTDGTREHIAGGLNRTLIAGPTSAAFGRGRKDQNVLYVVTSGAQAAPVSGTEIVGAQVVAIDVTSGAW